MILECMSLCNTVLHTGIRSKSESTVESKYATDSWLQESYLDS